MTDYSLYILCYTNVHVKTGNIIYNYLHDFSSKYEVILNRIILPCLVE